MKVNFSQIPQRSIIVTDFHELPADIQHFCDRGGDEYLVVFIPENVGFWPEWLIKLGIRELGWCSSSLEALKKEAEEKGLWLEIDGVRYLAVVAYD